MKNTKFTDITSGPSHLVETPELDVTPVMNMFVILIPFLVSMAVFTQLSILNFSLPPNVGVGLDKSADKPRIKMTVVVAPDYLALTHGDTLLDSIAFNGADDDLATLSKRLAVRRGEIDIQDEAVVAVRDSVRFKHVVAVMDRCKEAGFKKLGLSNANANPEGGMQEL